MALPEHVLLDNLHLPAASFTAPPDPLMTPEEAGDIIDEREGRQRRLYGALSFIAADACIRTPDRLGDAQDLIRSAIHAHFSPTGDMPTEADASYRVWLAGSMALTNRLLADRAATAILPWSLDTPPKMGPAGNYVTLERGVLPYEEGSVEDLHMNMNVKALTDASEYIALHTSQPGSIYERWAPVFRLEKEIRQSLPDMTPVGSTQSRELPVDPFDYERVRLSVVQFVRNIMHGTLLLTADQPIPCTLDHLSWHVRHNVQAFEIAALYPRDMQRTRMGIPGEPYDSFRRKYNITPKVVQIGDQLRFAGLEEVPANPRMCSGAGAHDLSEGLQVAYGEKKPLSAIYKYVMLALRIAPFSLFRDVPRTHLPDVEIMPSRDARAEGGNMAEWMTRRLNQRLQRDRRNN